MGNLPSGMSENDERLHKRPSDPMGNLLEVGGSRLHDLLKTHFLLLLLWLIGLVNCFILFR